MCIHLIQDLRFPEELILSQESPTFLSSIHNSSNFRVALRNLNHGSQAFCVNAVQMHDTTSLKPPIPSSYQVTRWATEAGYHYLALVWVHFELCASASD